MTRLGAIVVSAVTAGCGPLATPGLSCSEAFPCAVLPGPGSPDWSEAEDRPLLLLAERVERQHRLLNGSTGSFPAVVVLSSSDWRALSTAVLGGHDPWPNAPHARLGDFYGRLGYAGLELGASAIRHRLLLEARAVVDLDAADLRDQMARARGTLVQDILCVNRAFEVTGTSSVAARKVFVEHDRPRVPFPEAHERVPLFDATGLPQPPLGPAGSKPRSWREGRGPPSLGPWQDGVANVDLLGFAVGAALAVEAAEADRGLGPQEAVEVLRTFAAGLLGQLRTLRDDGRDLEYRELDGRPTPRTQLRPEDDVATPGFRVAIALGLSASLARVTGRTEDQTFAASLPNRPRWLAWLEELAVQINSGPPSSRMSEIFWAFIALWAIDRYHPDARVAAGARAARDALYAPSTDTFFRPDVLEVPPLDVIAFESLESAEGRVSARDRVRAALLRLGPAPLLVRRRPACTDAACRPPTPNHALLTRSAPVLVEPALPLEIRGVGLFEWTLDPHRIDRDGLVYGEIEIAPPTAFRWAYWLGRLTRVAP